MVENITDTLKNTFSRLTYGDRWMVWNNDRMTWVVYEKRYRISHGVVIVETDSEKEAVKKLTEGDSCGG